VHPFSGRATPEIGVDELDCLLRDDDVCVLDVREEWEFRRGRVPGALHVPLGQLAQRAAGLPRDKRILVICEHGNRSLAAADFLRRVGFADAASVRGGTAAWAADNRPVDQG
jgi:rhodanese-related sulfurtransferase